MQRARTCSSTECTCATGFDVAQSGRTEGSVEVFACSHANCAPVAASFAVRRSTQCRKRQGLSQRCHEAARDQALASVHHFWLCHGVQRWPHLTYLLVSYELFCRATHAGMTRAAASMITTNM